MIHNSGSENTLTSRKKGSVKMADEWWKEFYLYGSDPFTISHTAVFSPLWSGAVRALLSHPLRVRLSHTRLVQSIINMIFCRSLMYQHTAKQTQRILTHGYLLPYMMFQMSKLLPTCHTAITVVEVLECRDAFFTLAATLCNTSLLETTLSVGPKQKKKPLGVILW